jgi:hypothetical protein
MSSQSQPVDALEVLPKRETDAGHQGERIEVAETPMQLGMLMKFNQAGSDSYVGVRHGSKTLRSEPRSVRIRSG